MKRGDSILIDGVRYFVTHVRVDGKRGEVTLIAEDEARQRRDDLNELLGDDEVMCKVCGKSVGDICWECA